MTEDQLRAAMQISPDELPDPKAISDWAKATGLTKARVREIYAEVIGEPDPWGMPLGFKEDGQ